VHDPGRGRMAGRGVETLVAYASQEPSAFAEMLGGLIDANVRAHTEKQKDFDALVARVGIWVTDIDEGVTLVFESGSYAIKPAGKPLLDSLARGLGSVLADPSVREVYLGNRA